ncbi:ABC transporter ATP-binding protein [Microbacterium sp. NPDC079995]|uniref:ABC transporter ATP-binding protein n=1 Tax=unclassified Microbacterium TaxID=2609290 RepID=UPI0034506562
MSAPVLKIQGLSVDYAVEPRVHALADVDLELHRGEVLGIAGESGCGKSTLAYAVTRLLKPPAEVVSGEVHFLADGEDVRIDQLEGEALRRFRWDRISMVFQGAMNALNPVLSIGAQLGDVFTTHRPGMKDAERRAACARLLEKVGVPADRLTVYPHQLSGGMRQRVMIAMALALDPPVMIMDEPTTALDVVVQREILDEILRLRDEFGFAVIFITHDLPLLLEISDRIAVMREGRITELAPTRRLYEAPEHPYTRELLRSFPSLTGDQGGFVRTGAVRVVEEER